MEIVHKLHASVLTANKRIKSFVYHTPLEHSLYFSKLTGSNLYLKLESQQRTGSFKVRGAFNKLLSYDEGNGTKELFITASTGNHGMACAIAMTTLKKKGIIYVPVNASSAKLSNLKLYNVEIRQCGNDCVETEVKARSTAESEGGLYISPYADLQVAAGQGTIGIEIEEDLANVDVIFVTVGGGGLIGGIGSYFKSQNKPVEIVGCLPENSPHMYESIKSGEIVDIPTLDTLSDGSAGGIEKDSLTFPLCQKVVDRWVLVNEEEIANAIYLMLDKHCKIIEGAAGVALASFLKVSQDYSGKNVVVLICGGNIAIEKIKKVIDSKI